MVMPRLEWPKEPPRDGTSVELLEMYRLRKKAEKWAGDVIAKAFEEEVKK